MAKASLQKSPRFFAALCDMVAAFKFSDGQYARSSAERTRVEEDALAQPFSKPAKEQCEIMMKQVAVILSAIFPSLAHVLQKILCGLTSLTRAHEGAPKRIDLAQTNL